LIAIAIAAVVPGFRGMRRRAEAYRERAEKYAHGEAFHLRHIGRYATEDPEWDWVIRQKAAYCTTMRQQYELAAARPWMIVPPDPPYPWEAVIDRRNREALERRRRP
jgi:hypothetical protein